MDTKNQIKKYNIGTLLDDCPSITAFHHSAYQNLPLLLREFLSTRAKDINVFNEFGESGLSKACTAGHNDIVLTLIQHGADVNLPNMFTKITPLMTAAYHGHCDVIRILAHNDADAAIKDMFVILNTSLYFQERSYNTVYCYNCFSLQLL